MIFSLIIACLSLILFWVFYYIFLHRSTHFQVKRLYLVSSVVLSLLIPFSGQFKISNHIEHKAIERIKSNSIGKNMLTNSAAINQQLSSFTNKNIVNKPWVSFVYFSGCLILLLRLFISFVCAIKIRYHAQQIQHLKYTVYESNKINQPFTLFAQIFIPKNNKQNITNEILIHEKAHVNQHHFLDILMIEIVAILLWFNPILYFYKKAIRLNIEYMADEAVISSGVNVSEYQSCLLSRAIDNYKESKLTLNFATPLKNRIDMMTKRKSKNWIKLTLFGIIPLSLTLLAFNTNTGVKTTVKKSLAPIEQFIIRNNTPAGSPLKLDAPAKVTSEFGTRMHPVYKTEMLHKGIDLKAPTGTKVYATADGIVEISEFDDARGNYLQIKHGDEYTTQFSHLNNDIVEIGEKVKKGQLIAFVGNTGKSTSPHLHYEVHKNDVPVNPKAYLTKQ